MNNSWNKQKQTIFNTFGEKAEKKTANSFETSYSTLFQFSFSRNGFSAQGKAEKDRAGCYGSVNFFFIYFSCQIVLETSKDELLSASKMRESLDNTVTPQSNLNELKETWILIDYLTKDRETSSFKFIFTLLDPFKSQSFHFLNVSFVK